MSNAEDSPSTSEQSQNVLDVDKILNREASALQREVEVERILKAFRLNPYDVFDLKETATAEDIKKKFRQISLFIHPDKCSHERAPEAFDILKKAESELSDKPKRDELDGVINEARSQLLKALNLPTSTTDSDPRLHDLDPPFKVRLKAQSKQLLIDEELLRRKAIKMNLANEGLEARKKDEEISQKKRKAEDDKLWEETRDQRVDSWRSFATTSKKKKKTKTSILG